MKIYKGHPNLFEDMRFGEVGKAPLIRPSDRLNYCAPFYIFFTHFLQASSLPSNHGIIVIVIYISFGSIIDSLARKGRKIVIERQAQ
jgi:hypothetical protein